MLDEDLQVQQVEQQGGRADEDVWKIGRVNLTEVTRQKPILGETDQLARVRALSPTARSCHSVACGVRTLAISSLFLNSPSTMMTFPSPSTSVQRSLGSSAALALIDRRGKIESPVSGSNRRKSSGLSVWGPFLENPNNRSTQVCLQLSSECESYCLALLVAENASVWVLAGVRGFLNDFGLRDCKPTTPACMTPRLPLEPREAVLRSL